MNASLLIQRWDMPKEGGGDGLRQRRDAFLGASPNATPRIPKRHRQSLLTTTPVGK